MLPRCYTRLTDHRTTAAAVCETVQVLAQYYRERVQRSVTGHTLEFGLTASPGVSGLLDKLEAAIVLWSNGSARRRNR